MEDTLIVLSSVALLALIVLTVIRKSCDVLKRRKAYAAEASEILPEGDDDETAEENNEDVPLTENEEASEKVRETDEDSSQKMSGEEEPASKETPEV